MSSSRSSAVIVVSLQVQTSFQSVPLGAASVVSALRADRAVSDAAGVYLADWSLEENELAGLDSAKAGELLSRRIVSLFADSFPEAKTRIVGFSMYVWNRPVFESAASLLRKSLPGVVLFAGGPEVTAAPGSFEVPDSSPLFDHLLCGEGEVSSVDLVRSLLVAPDGTSRAAQDATSAPVIHSRAPSVDCANLPSPWLDGTLENAVAFRDCKGALWELARGCPYKCAYCYESKGEKKVRLIPTERLGKELEYFVRKGVERVFVLDPTYNASRERALSTLALIAKKAPEIHFNFEVRAEHLDREMVEAFGRIPCSLQIGLQSTNPEALALVNRPVDTKVFSKKIGLLNDAGIVFGLDLMYGLPGDTLTAFRASVDYAVGLYPNNLEIFRLAVLPGTDLADRAASLGLRHMTRPPYHIESTPKFPAQDLARAGELALACDAFYTQGRAVTWFLSALRPIKLKPSQFFQDFAEYIALPATRKAYPEFARGQGTCSVELTHARAESLQIEFLKKKFADKDKAYLVPALIDVIRINGAWTRALAEGEKTKLSLSYHPEDLFSPDAMDLEYFTENAYMEQCEVRVFSGPEGPDIDIS
jgi:hypothetical protein